jgi:uncharacterized protein (DUF2141 family)
MKKTIILGMLSLSMLGVNAQELPKPSPMAAVTQAVGLNTIKIEYSRPSVKGRKVFGTLVPFNKVWRLGANAPTKLTTDKPMTFGNETLKPGTYAIFVIPTENEWKVVINTDIEQWGAGNYDEKKNIVTITIKTQESEFTESLSITVQDLTSNSGSIVIAWDKTKVVTPFTVDTHKAAVDNIELAIKEGKDLEKVYANAASYYKDALTDLKAAMEYVDKSIEIKPYHGNLLLKARILKEQGEDKKAINTAKEALKQAIKAEKKGYEDYIKETIEKWRK